MEKILHYQTDEEYNEGIDSLCYFILDNLVPGLSLIGTVYFIVQLQEELEKSNRRRQIKYGLVTRLLMGTVACASMSFAYTKHLDHSKYIDDILYYVDIATYHVSFIIISFLLLTFLVVYTLSELLKIADRLPIKVVTKIFSCILAISMSLILIFIGVR